MKRVFTLLAAVTLIGQTVFAQSVEDGKKFLYYQRYKSAKETFEKILADKPNNVEATYWLGQTLLGNKDSAGAANLYQKALTANGNAPLLLAGMGQILLMQGKKDEARQQFETALNLSKSKDVDVLNAIGLANVRARAGDATYAIEKLNLATQTKKFHDPSTYVILGDAYRKMIDGGNAVTSYNKALEIDPKYALAKLRIGQVYLTQRNSEFYLPAFEQATQLDSTFGPAYQELYYYWYYHDVNKAGGYLDKLVAHSDPGPEMDSWKTDYTYAKGDFAGAKQRAQQLIAADSAHVSPRMYRMVAYTSDTLGDPATAKQAMMTFLAKADSAAVKPDDYMELAKIQSKIPEDSMEVFKNFQSALGLDTSIEGKKKIIQSAADLALASGNKTARAEWLGQAYSLEKEPGARDLYNWAYAYYQAGDYVKSDSLFCGIYVPKYPDQIYGYLWCARSKQAQDTSNEKGLAVDAYKALAEKAISLDTTPDKKYKPYAVSANFFLASYYNDVAKQKDTAIQYLKKVLEIDSSNESATNALKVLTAPPPKARTASKSTGKSTGAKSAGSKAGTKPKSSAAKKKSAK